MPVALSPQMAHRALTPRLLGALRLAPSDGDVSVRERRQWSQEAQDVRNPLPLCGHCARASARPGSVLSLPPWPPFASVAWHGCDADFAVFRVGLLLPALEAGGPASPGRCGNLATSWGTCDLVDALLGRRSCGRDKHTPSSLVEGVLSLTSHWVTRLGPSAAPWEQGRQATRTNPHWGQELGSTVAGNSSLSHNASGHCTWQPLCEPTAPANPTRHWAPLPKTSCLRGQRCSYTDV